MTVGSSFEFSFFEREVESTLVTVRRKRGPIIMTKVQLNKIVTKIATIEANLAAQEAKAEKLRVSIEKSKETLESYRSKLEVYKNSDEYDESLLNQLVGLLKE